MLIPVQDYPHHQTDPILRRAFLPYSKLALGGKRGERATTLEAEKQGGTVSFLMKKFSRPSMNSAASASLEQAEVEGLTLSTK